MTGSRMPAHRPVRSEVYGIAVGCNSTEGA